MDITKRNSFSNIFNAKGDTGSTFNSVFQMPFAVKDKKKSRNFDGAWTKRSYGPVFDPDNDIGKTFNSALTDGGDSAGVAMSESNEEKFLSFLESMRNEENSSEIDIIREGFEVINESEDLTEFDNPDDIVNSFYGVNNETEEDLSEYEPYINELAKIIYEKGYWSDEVFEYNRRVPDNLDIGKLHTKAKLKAKYDM